MRVLFYSDVNDFGGHESMTVNAVNYIAKNSDWDISFAVFEGNRRYISALSEILGVHLIHTKHASRSLQGFRSWTQFDALRNTENLLRKAAPDIVVLSQGGIEQCTVGLIAASRAGFRTLSYIPYAHTYAKMRSSLGWLRDIIDTPYYKLPNRYITIGHSMSVQLRDRGVTRPICIVPNGIVPPQIGDLDRNALRTGLGVSYDEYLVGIIGRVVFGQKGHDVLARAIATVRKTKPLTRMIVVGDGPDLENLTTLSKKLGIHDSTIFRPWSKEVAEVYRVLDVIAIPSRFEGVPLVMLEAMACSVPIVASNIDGMLDILPSEWLFDSGDDQDLAETLTTVLGSNQTSQIEINRERALTEFSVEQFGRGFMSAIETAAKV